MQISKYTWKVKIPAFCAIAGVMISAGAFFWTNNNQPPAPAPTLVNDDQVRALRSEIGSNPYALSPEAQVALIEAVREGRLTPEEAVRLAQAMTGRNSNTSPTSTSGQLYFDIVSLLTDTQRYSLAEREQLAGLVERWFATCGDDRHCDSARRQLGSEIESFQHLNIQRGGATYTPQRLEMDRISDPRNR